MARKRLLATLVASIICFNSFNFSSTHAKSTEYQQEVEEKSCVTYTARDKKTKRPIMYSPEKGVFQIINGFHYVNPNFVENLTKYPVRMNWNAFTGTGVFVSPQNPVQKAFFNYNVGLGFDLIVYNFWFAFGIQAYGLIGNVSGSSAQWIFGYKFRFAIGAILYFGENSKHYVKIGLVYADNQLQLVGGKNENFGYFSRTPGATILFRVTKGLELGLEANYTLMHTNTDGLSADPKNNFSSVLINAVLRFTF